MQSIRKKSFAAEQLARQKKKNPVTIVAIVIAVVFFIGVIGYALYMRFGEKEEPIDTSITIPKGKPSVAVLSLYDSTPQRDKEYMCEGIADAIILALQHVKAMDVKSRNSSFVFKGENRNLRAIGDSLKADYVLEGSLYNEGNIWRITTQLINASEDVHVWGDKYDFEEGNLIAIQDSISLAIVEALKIELLGEEKAAVIKHPTNNIEAYKLVLMGWYLASRTSSDADYEKVLDCYQQAVSLDPDFALAHVSIAWLYNYWGRKGYKPREEAFPKARIVLDTAYKIDKEIPEYYIVLAEIRLWDEWDWTAAEREYKRAIMLNPGNSNAHREYARFLRMMGRYDEAIEEIEKTQKIDPYNIDSYGEAIVNYTLLGDYEKTLEAFGKAEKLDPENPYVYQHLGRMYYKQGNYNKALEIFQEIKTTGIEEEDTRNFRFGYIYALAGRRDEAKKLLQKMINQKASAEYIAMIYGALGENDKAFEWLEKAYNEHNWAMPFLKADIEWDPIRSDPRFETLMKKMNLPVD